MKNIKHRFGYKNIAKLFVLLLVQWQMFSLSAQTTAPMFNTPTPEAANIGLYGEIPVSLYTGIPDISIPLYEINVDNISIPISASYHLASVKPNVLVGNLGLGWTLQFGGCITRSVRGIYDEKKHANGDAPGYYSHSEKMKNITSQQFASHTSNIQSSTWASTYYELAADEFSFNFCGYSGNFYYNENGGWTVSSDQDIKVIFDPTDGFINLSQLSQHPFIKTSDWLKASSNNRFFNKFTLVTPDGYKYLFGGSTATEYSIPYYSRDANDLIPTSWYLTKIITPRGREIDYTYQVSEPICDIRYSPQRIALFNYPVITNSQSNQTIIGYSALTGFLSFPVTLKQIVTPYETIDFHFIEDLGHIGLYADQYLAWKNRTHSCGTIYQTNNSKPADQFHKLIGADYGDTEKELRENVKAKFKWKKLHAISIKGKFNSVLSKCYYFDYNHQNRRKLALITERAGEYIKLIEYVGVHILYPIHQIPPKPQGYNLKEYRFKYNNSERFPSMYVNAGEDSWGYYNGKTTSISAYPSFYIAYPSSLYTKGEVLTEIEYPTKGKTMFEYELHNYSKVVSPSFTSVQNTIGSAGGLRVSRIKTYSSKDVLLQAKQYYYSTEKSSSVSSGILRGLPVNKVTYYASGGAQLQLESMGGFSSTATQQNTPHVGYSSVIEETLDASLNTVGYVRYRFSNYDRDIWNNSHFDEPAYYSMTTGDNYINSFSSKAMERGKLLSEEYYDVSNRLVRSVSYQYTKTPNTNYMITASQAVIVFYPLDYAIAKIGSLSRTYIYSYKQAQKIENIYDSSGKGIVYSTKQYYAYNQSKQLRSDSIAGSNGGDSYVTYYTYPGDIIGSYTNVSNNTVLNVYRNMVNRNMLNIPVEIIKRKGNKTISAIVNTYKAGAYYPIRDNIYEPEGAYSLVKDKTYELESTVPVSNLAKLSFTSNSSLPTLDSRMKLATSYNLYDRHNNPTEIIHRGIPYAYQWGYEGLFLASMTENSTLANVNGSNPNSATDKRTHYYDYDLSGRLTSVYDNSRRRRLYYKYDSLGRLVEVSEFDTTSGRQGENVLKSFRYNYINK